MIANALGDLLFDAMVVLSVVTLVVVSVVFWTVFLAQLLPQGNWLQRKLRIDEDGSWPGRREP